MPCVLYSETSALLQAALRVPIWRQLARRMRQLLMWLAIIALLAMLASMLGAATK